jgi:hypothetical protein
MSVLRGFATVTVVAVTAVIGTALGLVVWLIGTIEAEGLLAASVTVQLDDMPADRTGSGHIRFLTDLARQHRVDAALVTPSRDGDAGAWTAVDLRGGVHHPALWAEARERPAASIRAGSLGRYLAIDGDAAEIQAFRTDLTRDGYVHSEVSPSTGAALTRLMTRVPIVGLGTALVLGLLVVLTAEAIRRSCRQRLRALCGWHLRSILARESSEMALLAGSVAIVLLGALFVFLGFRGASVATLRVALGLLIPMSAASIVLVVVVHALATLTLRSVRASTRRPRARPSPRPAATR